MCVCVRARKSESKERRQEKSDEKQAITQWHNHNTVTHIQMAKITYVKFVEQ